MQTNCWNSSNCLSLSFLYLLISLLGAVRSPPLFSPLPQCISTSEIHKALGAAPACRWVGWCPGAVRAHHSPEGLPSFLKGATAPEKAAKEPRHTVPCPETKPLQGHLTVHLLLLTPGDTLSLFRHRCENSMTSPPADHLISYFSFTSSKLILPSGVQQE